MVLLLEDSPVLTPDAFQKPEFITPGAEMATATVSSVEAPLQGFALWLTRAYMSSFNICLSQLGWVPKRILEVGCGDGSMLSYVGQTFMDSDVVGVTFGPRSAEQARSNTCCRIHFEETDPSECLPFKDNDFDVVIAHGWLADTPLPHHWIREITRVSAEGVILSALNPIGEQWTRWVPGARDVRLTGQLVFAENRKALSANRLTHWLSEAGCTVELKTYPLPFTMVMGRKPQAQSTQRLAQKLFQYFPTTD